MYILNKTSTKVSIFNNGMSTNMCISNKISTNVSWTHVSTKMSKSNNNMLTHMSIQYLDKYVYIFNNYKYTTP